MKKSAAWSQEIASVLRLYLSKKIPKYPNVFAPLTFKAWQFRTAHFQMASDDLSKLKTLHPLHLVSIAPIQHIISKIWYSFQFHLPNCREKTSICSIFGLLDSSDSGQFKASVFIAFLLRPVWHQINKHGVEISDACTCTRTWGNRYLNSLKLSVYELSFSCHM